MLNRILKTLAIAVLMIGGASSAAFAQMAATVYNGTETAAGDIDPVSGFRYGKTYVLSSTGEWDTRYLTITVNDREMLAGIGVTGGTWLLTIHSDTEPSGAIYGRILSGKVTFGAGKDNLADKPELMTTELNLVIDGGVGHFALSSSTSKVAGLELVTVLKSGETNAFFRDL